MSTPRSVDLRRVAHHEAGHWTIAHHAFGIDARITIDANSFGHYSGLCTFMPARNPEVNRAIALSGGVAEAFSEALHGDAESDLLSLARQMLSAEDIALAGQFSPNDLQVAAYLCRKYWPEIVQSAANQIVIVTWREKQTAMLQALAA